LDKIKLLIERKINLDKSIKQQKEFLDK
jgi:hypothetical protein